MDQIMAGEGSKHSGLQSRLGYQFKDRALLDQALRHPSRGGVDNQRLEFLGDRVLGLVIADLLYAQFPEMKEGDLAPRYNHLVRKERCAEVADALSLGNDLLLGRSESMSGGRRKKAALGDACEALIAAIYLDGGFVAAREFIHKHWAPKLAELPEDTTDAKTKLQEFLQGSGQPPPVYEVVDRSGPDHAPEFVVEVRGGNKQAQATGKSKRGAEQRAATALLKLIGETENE